MFERYTSSSAGGSEDMVLGIETSCDDTGVAVVSSSGRVLSDALVSQVSVESCTPCRCFCTTQLLPLY